MSRAARVPWWRYGVIGGMALSFVTLLKVLAAIPRFFTEDVPWDELAYFPFLIFGMGFVCGSLVGLLLPLSKWLGAGGDTLIGIVVMNVFFLGCMLCYDRKMLAGEAPGALPMLMLATIIGIIGGVWLGRDFRRDEDQRQPPENQ